MWKNIANQINRLFTYNTGLKCLSLVAAALLWLLVVNLDDPTQSRNFTATVTLENEGDLTKQGKYYELPEGNTVTFRVTARRSVIEDLSSSDFGATADFERLEDDERIPIELTAKRHTNALTLSSKTHYLKVLVQDLSETTFMVQAQETGKAADGFAVGEIGVSPNIISVNGPADVVSAIETVKVQVDVSGQMDNFKKSLVPKYYNKEGQEIDTTTLTFSTESVEVSVDMQSVQEINISVETRGELKKGLELGGITTSPSTILLKGQPEIINNITTITIPGDVIDLSNLTGDFETTVDIMSYVPKGITLASNENSQVAIKVDVLSESVKSFRIKTSNLTLRNLNPGLTGIFESSYVDVKVSGLETLLDDLDAETMAGFVDVSGLTEGIHSVSVVLELDKGLTASKATTDVDIQPLEDKKQVDAEEEKSSKKDSSKEKQDTIKETESETETNSKQNTETNPEQENETKTKTTSNAETKSDAEAEGGSTAPVEQATTDENASSEGTRAQE